MSVLFRAPSAPLVQRPVRLSLALLLVSGLLSSGCAQRAQLSPLHARSFKTIFSAQAVAKDGKLVATTAEDAKDILKRRQKMKSDAVSGSSRASRVMSRAASQFSLGGR